MSKQKTLRLLHSQLYYAKKRKARHLWVVISIALD